MSSSRFRSSFNCLWCGRTHQTRSETDLEGYAGLCPDCLGRAQDNAFLRFRLKEALTHRARATERPPDATGSAGSAGPASSGSAGLASSQSGAQRPDGSESDLAVVAQDDQLEAAWREYRRASVKELDDWYARGGRYRRGPAVDLAWQVELDQATQWLDGLAAGGEIAELVAGAGWWSPLLAQKGELALYDVVEEGLDEARRRLVAHGLRAHLHVRDVWAEPDHPVDLLFTGPWLSHLPRRRLDGYLRLALGWLKPGGRYAFVDVQRDPNLGAVDEVTASADDPNETELRRVADGREFRLAAVYREPSELEAQLRAAGFVDPSVTATDRFFVLGSAVRPLPR